MPNAWVDGEEELVDERNFTPWAKPDWLSWNAYSPELSFCIAAGLLAMYQGGLVIETGAGQGYVTRRLGVKSDVLHVYESNDGMRSVIPDDGPWLVMPDRTPDVEDIKNCSLMVADSSLAYRLDEIKRWHEHADKDSLLFIHDAGNGHENHTPHSTHIQHWKLIKKLGLTGIKYTNPRGAFLAWKNEPKEMEFLRSILPTE